MHAEPDWVDQAIWWQLYPFGFVGAYPRRPEDPATPGQHRLRRIIAWLDHAVELGVSGIALGPIFASSGHGYDTVDHFRIDPRLGDDGDFDALVAAAHDRGLRVQLDGVFNHVGSGHPRALAARRDGPGSPAAAWFRTQVDAEGTHFATFEGHEALLALDHASSEVEDYVVQVMGHWLTRGADAWRLDAAYAVAPEFWARALTRVRATHPSAWFVGEVIHGDYAGIVEDSRMDTVTQYELWKAIWSSINDANFYELDWALSRHNGMLDVFTPATFIGNHDVTRIATRITDPRHGAHALVLLMTLGGTPTIYAGDELGYHGLKEDRPGGDDAIRPEFPEAGPGPVAPEAAASLRLHQDLIGLRRRHPWLHRASTTTHQLRDQQYIFETSHERQSLVVALNLADEPLAVPPRLVSSAPPLAADAASLRVAGSIAPHGWAVLDGAE